MCMMINRLPLLLALLILPLGQLSTVAQEPLNTPKSSPKRKSTLRLPAPRPEKTIFSALDLPAPSRERMASGAPGPEYWQQQVDYVIQASLDDHTGILAAKSVITYTNNSPVALDYIWLSLPQNILKPDSKAALKTGSGGRFAIGKNSPKGFVISKMSSGGSNLVHSVYGTVARVDLPSPVAPGGGTFSFNLDWSFEVPSSGRGRMGVRKGSQGPVYELAQWFPNVCVYDDAHGWNTLPYIGSGEFYTNFGEYDVRLTVPRDHIVAATGVLQNPSDILTTEQMKRLAQAKKSESTVIIRGKDEVATAASRPDGTGPLTWHFKASKVRTFAWATSAAFIWDASYLEGTGPDGSGTLVQSVYPVEAYPLWTKSTHMLRSAIQGYSKRWFPYPYPSATNVNGIAGGMEYPMIIFCAARERRGSRPGSAERGLWGVTTHEIGHNWFPMVVNTDERRHAWMDEGFNTFINHYSTVEFYGEQRRGRTSGRGFARSMRGQNQAPIATPPDHLPRAQLGMLQYTKTGVGMRLLREQILGPERFDAAFRTYIRRWAFKSPRPADFFRTMEDAAGADLAWFWRGWFLESARLDQAVGRVRPRKGGKTVRVTFTNNEELVMPLVFKATWSDGSTEVRSLPVEIWATSNRWSTTLQTNGRALTEILIDPERVFPDIDAKNNSWKGQVKE